MPNWVQQDLHVVGPKPELDRFIRAGFRRDQGPLKDDLLLFTRLCPLRRGEPRDVYTHDSAVVLSHMRTHTQAIFALITSWDYPAEFYNRLPHHWPSLSFMCAVNEEMDQCGGLVLALDGRTQNAVRDYDAGYSRRAHAREILPMQQRWAAVVRAGRNWRVMASDMPNQPYVRFDACFDDDWRFFFRSRHDLVRFCAKYPAGCAMRRVAGKWKRVRLRR